MNRSAIVAANWKMNGDYELISNMTNALSAVELKQNAEIVICPSYPYLIPTCTEINALGLQERIFVGAQNVSEQANGAYTGEVSTSMLQEIGVKYVIIGHSERRSLYNESNQLVALKVQWALQNGLTPILCIGESELERDTEQTEQVLAQQLQAVIDQVGIKAFSGIVIAYEPVWAIGTGKTASPAMAQETHQFIRQYLSNIDGDVAQKVPLLYGGSVNAANCEELFAQIDIDGGLIGGASLKVDEFTVICSTLIGK